MGITCHNSIIVTGQNYAEDTLFKAKEKAVELFGYALVSPVIYTELNGYMTFFVAPDGSMEGWPEAEDADSKRKTLCDFLDTLTFSDGSSSISYVDVAYGDTYGGKTAHIERSNLKQKENAPLTLIFGNGEIGVTTAATEKDTPGNSLIFWNIHNRKEVGEKMQTPEDIDILAQLIFHNMQSVDVLINALNQIKTKQGGG